MKTKLMIFLVALLFVAPLAALAGTADIEYTGNKFYYIGAPLPAAQYDPDDPDPDAAGWANGFQDGNGEVPPDPPGTLPFVAGQDLVLARRNLNIDNNVKYFTVTILYNQDVPGVGELEFQSSNSGSIDGPVSTATVWNESSADGVYLLNVIFDPQPDWEWVRIQTTGAVTLNSITWNTQCYTNDYVDDYDHRIPSLTQWGLFVLIIMLGGSAGWILWRRRAHAGI
jgi:hypothetical protein